MEDILKKLSSGTAITADEASLLWSDCHFLELSSHVQELLTPTQRATANLWVELEIADSIAPHAGFLLETYNKIHRPSAPGQDLRSWFQSVAIRLPVHLEWRRLLETCRVWKDPDHGLPVSAFEIHEVKQLAEICSCSLKEILGILKENGIHEIPTCTRLIGDQDGDDGSLTRHVWFELQQALAEAGLKGTAFIDLNMPWHEAIELLKICRSLQDETGVLSRCLFYFSGTCLSQQQLENSLKLLAISRSFLRNVPIFELKMSAAITPYVSLFSQLGIERISKTVSFPCELSHSTPLAFSDLNLFRQLWTKVLAEVRLARRTARTQVRYRYLESQLPKISQETAVSLLLYKADRGENLSEDELIQLAFQASIYSLGQCSRSLYQQKKNWIIPYQLTEPLRLPQSKVDQGWLQQSSDQMLCDLDLASPSLKTLACLQDLLQQLRLIKQQNPDFRFVFRGLKSLFQRAAAEQLDLSNFISQLPELGLKLAISSEYESEQDLTHSELIKIHQAFHKSHVPTIARVEVVVPYAGDEVPFWDQFCQRLSTFRKLDGTGQVLQGIGVGIAPGCRINLSEYLRALAITRIFFKNTPQFLFHGLEFEIDLLDSWQQLLEEHPSLLVGYGVQCFGFFTRASQIRFSLIDQKLTASSLKPSLQLIQ